MCSGRNLSYSLAGLFALLDVICGIIVYAIPGSATKLMEYLTHSTWQFTIKPFDPVSFAIGIVLWLVIGFAVGELFSKLFEMCGGKKCC